MIIGGLCHITRIYLRPSVLFRSFASVLAVEKTARSVRPVGPPERPQAGWKLLEWGTAEDVPWPTPRRSIHQKSGQPLVPSFFECEMGCMGVVWGACFCLCSGIFGFSLDPGSTVHGFMKFPPAPTKEMHSLGNGEEKGTWSRGFFRGGSEGTKGGSDEQRLPGKRCIPDQRTHERDG